MNIYLIIFLVLVLIYFIYLYFTDTSHLNSIDRCSKKYNRDKIYEFENLLSIDECNTIIDMAEPNIKKSTVMGDNPNHPGRTSSHVFLKTNNNLLQKIDNIVYSYLQIPVEHYEDLQVVNYKSTQKYDAHYDACDPSEEICQKEGIPFDILQPLILETAQKIKNSSPSLAQTGPAQRGDFETIAKHLMLLENDERKC